jgi:uncharacterized protein YgiM (DUF1202 family)
MNLRHILWTAALLLMAASAWAETGKMSRVDNLREKPFANAKVVSKLTAGQEVDIVKRQGAWYQVKVANKLGWVNMLSVRKTATAAVASGKSLSQVATGRTGTGTVVATSGIRGLNEENLRQATFQEEPVAYVEKFRAAEPQARKFASAAGLKPRTVPLLTPTAPPAPNAGQENQP